MLTALSIRDFVLIESLDLELGPGLSVLTGETGAGKSILLDALGLALGARADSAQVRRGEVQAVVSAAFDPPPDHPVRALLDAEGLGASASEPILVRRIVRADGGSRASVNDQPASVGLLRDLGSLLVEVHGQHDDRGLLAPRSHLALLDAFGGIDTAPVAAAYDAMGAADTALAEARAALEEAERDREWLAHAAAELAAIAPQPGEEETLAGLRSDMQKGARLGDDLSAAAILLEGSDGGLAALRQAARRLERIAPEHPSLARALAALDRALAEACEAEDALAEAAAALAVDPARLDEAETRLFDLRALARKHRVDPEALPALAADLEAKLAALESGAASLASLEEAREESRRAFKAAAGAVSRARADAAARLDSAVERELGPLRLDRARFRTSLVPVDDPAWGRSGIDRAEFEIATSEGAPFAALTRIASGGELARFILALKVALAGEGSARTLIFDEVDRGVGGAVASAVGERLHRLAGQSQLLVVTHSPQVAARGTSHLYIDKSHDGLVTRTGVRWLDEAARREEIARMLSGARVTDEARAQAGRLLEPA